MNEEKAILIPAYQPDEKLIQLVENLNKEGLFCLVIDDGSTGCDEIFDAVEKIGSTVVLHHEVNMGKGRALKTGFQWLYENNITLAITVDSDGQHSVADTLHIAEVAEKNPRALILGMRDVEKMPKKSRVGNDWTRKLFKGLYGIKLQDTQTGLRAIPVNHDNIDGLLGIEGDRYEYEMQMLIEASKLFPGGMKEVGIETLYFEENKGSHFRPIKDGAKIYAVLFKHLPGFILASFSSFLIDFALFNVLFYFLIHQALVSTVLARVVSAGANYQMNRKLVFKDAGEKYNLWNYIKLAVIILAINAVAMHILVDAWNLPAYLCKIVVELILYIVSFTVQHKLSYKQSEKLGKPVREVA